MSELADHERSMLELERSWWQYPGAKEAEVRRRFDLSMTSYYQRLNALINTEAALAFDPLVVMRLRRLRAQRERTRDALRARSEF